MCTATPDVHPAATPHSAHPACSTSQRGTALPAWQALTPSHRRTACRYKKLWDQDKDAYIRRYEKANKPLSSYELDIKEYLNKEVS